MSDRFIFKNQNDIKTDMENLICFKKEEDLLESSWKVKDETPGNSGLLSKYRKVLSCSFVKGTAGAASAERVKASKS